MNCAREQLIRVTNVFLHARGFISGLVRSTAPQEKIGDDDCQQEADGHGDHQLDQRETAVVARHVAAH